MSILVDNLERLLVKRIELHPQIEQDLLPGIDRATILNLMQEIPFSIPEELIELYEWRNGSAGGDPLFSSYEFRSLDFALNSYKLAIRSHRENPEESLWELNWFPIMDCNGEVELAVVLGTDEYSAPVQCIDVEMDVFERRFDSLTVMVQTVLVCFEADVFSWTSKYRTMYEDYAKYVEIHRRFNVNSERGPNLFGN